MAEATPLASVVIPTHQRREALRRLLLALADQSLPGEGYEVIVAIDGSTDGTAEMLADFDPPYRLRVLDAPGRGRAAACNAAIALARAEVLIVLDDDMEPVRSFVERHLAHHPPGSRLCVMGAVPIELDGERPRAARYVQTKFNAHLAELERPGHAFVPRDFYSGNASLRTAEMRGAGGFSESFTVYGNEDIDLSLRLREAGVELRYDPAARACQDYDKDLAALARDTTEKGHTTVQLARLHPEVLPMLRLSQPWDGSRPWLAARAVLLGATGRFPSLHRLAVAVAVLLERVGLWRQPLFYRAVLDYAFWAGADAELRESTPEGGLEPLARDLRRGPIDLLLHR